MSGHLIAISLGPVQDFIAAARRTRDLWFGSYVLSEISRAAAEALGRQQLIFPAPATLERRDVNIANVILAALDDGSDPSAARDRAHAAARGRWISLAEESLADEITRFIDQTRWEEQINDVIEFYAAWVPLFSRDDYARARHRAMRLLAGRKACRDFLPAVGHHGIPKSSLDGGRESIWNSKSRDGMNAELKARLRLSTGEQLDAVGFVKRMGGGKQPRPSVSTLAADPWMRGVGEERLSPLDEACRTLVGRPLRSEGTAVYRNRHQELADELGQSMHELSSQLKRLAEFGKPDPYLAILAADGDRMGKAISECRTIEEHRAFSHQLAEFAREARGIVSGHHGHLVYSGGDDVLALLPVDRCLECARDLRQRFGERVPRTTLSVGIAIGHFMEPLEDLREYARLAEKNAKEGEPERDGLAVHLHTRGGAPIRVRAQWRTGIDHDLLKLARWHMQNWIPDKAGYELRELARDYYAWPEEGVLDQALRADVARLLSRKRIEEGVDLAALQSIASERWTAANVVQLAKMTILARKIATVKMQAKEAVA